jgi:hypothetical protein
MFDVFITGHTAHIDTIFKFLPHTRRITAAVKNIDAPMLTLLWQELEYRIDVCHVTRGAHIEHIQLPKKKFSFPVAVNRSLR